MTLADRAFELYRNQGPKALFRRAFGASYDLLLREQLPPTKASYNGVEVLAARFGDRLLPWRDVDKPGYESALLNGIRSYAEEGDTVVIVGGGWGVSTVVAARMAGPKGEVITHEASPSSVSNVEKTVQLNSVADRVTVREVVVSKAISTRGSTITTNTLRPEQLPDCDMLVLDCEGVELEILSAYTGSPRVVVVETHGHLGTTRSEVTATLEITGYRVVDERLADESAKAFCERNDIHVLYAIDKQ